MNNEGKQGDGALPSPRHPTSAARGPTSIHRAFPAQGSALAPAEPPPSDQTVGGPRRHGAWEMPANQATPPLLTPTAPPSASRSKQLSERSRLHSWRFTWQNQSIDWRKPASLASHIINTVTIVRRGRHGSVSAQFNDRLAAGRRTRRWWTTAARSPKALAIDMGIQVGRARRQSRSGVAGRRHRLRRRRQHSPGLVRRLPAAAPSASTAACRWRCQPSSCSASAAVASDHPPGCGPISLGYANIAPWWWAPSPCRATPSAPTHRSGFRLGQPGGVQGTSSGRALDDAHAESR